MKINDIAKELGIPIPDALSKANAMGIDASNPETNLSEPDTLALKNVLIHGGAANETKIIKVKPRKAVKKDEEVRVTKKATIQPKPQKKAVAPGPANQGAAAPEREGAAAPPPHSEALGGNDKPTVRKTPAAPPRAPMPGAPVPVRIPSDKVIPTRIAREDAETADKDKPEGAEEALSKDVDTASKPTEPPADGDKAVAAPEADESREAVKADAADDAPAVEAVREVAGPATDKADKTDNAKADRAEPAVKSTSAPENPKKPSPQTGSGTQDRQGKQGRPDERPGHPHTGAKPAPGKKDGAHGRPGEKKPSEKTGTGKEGEKPKQGDAKVKAKDKKPSKGEKGKPGDSYSDKAKRLKLQAEKRKGGVDDFKGSKRSPILEDNSLEKRPVKTARRGRPQLKPAPEPELRTEDLPVGTKIINVPITVAGFAEQVDKSPSEVIMALMKLGIMANINQNIDETTTQLLGEELNVPIYIGSDAGEIVEEGLESFEDKPEDLSPRPPIITVMGHVDHGKTSLLDAIRKTNVQVGEAGGITQHIGASEVSINGEKIVFLDTPGHEAFTAMRARGAHTTDIAVLVVAADDGVMPQTLESISHAKAANVPIIVAINKMDKDGANPDRVKQELSDHGILVEDWGGDTICVPVSAKTGDGVVSLLEMILLQAEVLELKANPDRLAMGTVIEARLDKTKGAVATLLVLNGTLRTGDSVVAGTTSGKVRAMTDYNGRPIRKAGPATPVEITGLGEAPQAGDEFNSVKEDRIAREIAENRRIRQRGEIMAKTSGASLETLFSRIQEGEIKELNIIIKGDVQGSVGALTTSLEKLDTGNVHVRIIHTGVGAVTESDVMLASTSGAVIIGFNVRPTTAVLSLAESDGVEIRTYRVIYDAINDVEAALKGMLDPEFREVVLGKVEIRETFKVPGAGIIGGAYVQEGKIQRNAEIRLIRDGIVIHEGKISSLRRFKDDVREVASGYECGIGVEGYNDIKEGDVIEAFKMEEIERE